MKTIINNLAVEYSDEGSGPIILMLHGWADSLHTFDKLVAELPNFRIVRLDLPGFGNSERPASTRESTRGGPHEVWDVAAYARFIAVFCKKLQVEPVVIVGHSFGGRIAIKGVGTGVLTPEKLILIASAGIANKRTFKNDILRVVAKTGKAVTLVWPLSIWRQKIRRKLYENIGSDYFAAGSMRDTFLEVVGEDLLQYAKKIRVPTLLIWGSEDRSTLLKNGQRIHEAITHSQLKVINGATHFVHQERSQEVAQLITEFV